MKKFTALALFLLILTACDQKPSTTAHDPSTGFDTALNPSSSTAQEEVDTKQPESAPISQNKDSAPSSKEDGKEALVTSESAEKQVTYTQDGFSPSTLTIKKGDTVVFKNESQEGMWTASADHPTHAKYPTTGGCAGSTFDACKGITSGDSWSFQFDEKGGWTYHNHLNPGKTGKIIVE